MNRRDFLRLAGFASLSLVYSPSGFLRDAVAFPARSSSSSSPVRSLDALLGDDFVWLDSPSSLASLAGVSFSPPMDDAVVPSGMDGLPNDHRYGWMHRYTVQTDDGMVPDVSVSGASPNLVPYVSVRPVEGRENLYFVDVLFQTGHDVSSDNVVVTFSQVTGIPRYELPPSPGGLHVRDLSVSPNPVPCGEPAKIHYELSAPAGVSVRIYDVLGREVENMLIQQPASSGSFNWSPRNAASGLYLLQLVPRSGVPKTVKVRVVK